ncbi:MAG: PAS domain-containing protein, partial [Planctomycetes bacterium]|nr:PAS domain-containing protein [Planctomycetota bacterium]
MSSSRRGRRPAPGAFAPGGTDFRLFGRRFDRLTARLAFGTALLVVGPLAAGFYALSQHHYDQSIEAQQRAAELQSRILEAALRHEMVDQDSTLMAEIFLKIGDQPTVRSAMILDHEGEIRVASDPGLVGTRIDRDSPTCFVCHAKDADQRALWTLLAKDQEEVLRTVLPIENRAECHRCHDPAERWNGILILDTSLADLQAKLAKDVGWFVSGAALLALLLLGGLRFLVRFLILKRLARLAAATRSLAAGELHQRAQIGGDDVIASLAGDFDHMAATVEQLVSEVRHQEAQLANVMNSLDDGMVVLDRDSRVLASNRSFCRRLGTHPELLRGRRCHHPPEEVLPCCGGEEECPTIRCLALGTTQRGVYTSPSEDGGESVVEEVYASPVFDEAGEVLQVVEIWRDISERVQEELHFAEIERLVSLGTLASGFSPEVSTPLATMQTCADSVIGRIDEAGGAPPTAATARAIRDSADMIRSQVQRCRRITEQFLRFSRGIPPSLEAVDLAQVVAGVVSLAAPTAREAGVELSADGGQDLPTVRSN